MYGGYRLSGAMIFAVCDILSLSFLVKLAVVGICIGETKPPFIEYMIPSADPSKHCLKIHFLP